MAERARAGDRLAFNRLADHFQPEIYRMIYYRTRSQMDAEDLCQDVFLKAYRSIKGLKSAAVFRSWLYRIAVNRVKDYYRKKQFQSLFSFSSTDELRQRILNFIDYFNKTMAKPFKWTYTGRPLAA